MSGTFGTSCILELSDKEQFGVNSDLLTASHRYLYLLERLKLSDFLRTNKFTRSSDDFSYRYACSVVRVFYKTLQSILRI